jgi:predicted nucleotidyltransferase
MMSLSHTIVETFKEHLNQQKIPYQKIYWYGSSLHENPSVNTDIDILIIVKKVDLETRKQISNTAWEIGFDHDVFIHTVVMSEYEAFESPEKSSLFMKNIQNEGVLV